MMISDAVQSKETNNETVCIYINGTNWKRLGLYIEDTGYDSEMRISGPSILLTIHIPQPLRLVIVVNCFVYIPPLTGL